MRRLALFVFLLAGAAAAADRHVFLDTGIGGTGTLNQCPNPAHNTFITPSTGKIQYCVNGPTPGKVLGDATSGGRTYVSTCGSGGVATNISSGVSADVDGDGVNEVVYGSPQACIYGMAKSDSCEVHAGVYTKPGAQCTENCGSEPSTSNLVCDRHDCWMGTVFASGYFQNGHTDGYGTVGTPGYLRGAVMNSSTDTWDSNGNKQPDVLEAITSYPAIFNLDSNIGGGTTCTGSNDTTCHDATVCSTCPAGENCAAGFCSVTTTKACLTDSTCRGDSFYGLRVGCGAGSYGTTSCPPAPKAGATLPAIDADANGSFETSVGGSGPRNTDYLIFKDIEIEYGNGGPATVAASQGHRAAGGTINWGGTGNTEGARIDHVYLHNGGYSPTAAAGLETWWAAIQDAENTECDDYLEVKNSFVQSGNRWLYNNDCGFGPAGSACGCPPNFHDNRFVVAPVQNTQSNGFTYIKSIDSIGNVGSPRKKQMRFWNNEIIFQTTGTNTWLWDLQAFGNAMTGDSTYGHKCDAGTTGCGELWFYGNIVRGVGTSFSMSRINGASCGAGTGEWRFYNFNDTYDLEKGDGGTRDFDILCDYDHGPPVVESSKGKLAVEKNNLYFKSANLNVSFAVATTRVNNLCSESSGATIGPCTQTSPAGRTDWWTTGTKDVGIHAGLVNYRPKTGGPADDVTTNNPCDPDGDGAPGFKDWDGTTNVTTWTDIAGNVVNCPTIGTAIDLGAIQTVDCTNDICGNGKLCATGIGPGVHPEVCDDGNTVNETSCPYGQPTCLGCNSNCSATIPLTGTYCGDGILQTGNGEVCEPSLGVGSHTCAVDFSPCLTGTPGCDSGCHLTIGTCTDCAGDPGGYVQGGVIK